MISKRVFLTGAATAAAVAATQGRWVRTTAPAEGEAGLPRAAPPVDAVVFNDRYSDARAFAQALTAQGVPALPIEGDAGRLWYGPLGKGVAGGWRRVAGIGTSMDLLILESLGREAGLRLRFLGQHDCRGAQTLTHSIFTKDAPVASALAADLRRPDWPQALAAALSADGPRAGGMVCAHAAADLQVGTSVDRSPDHPGMLLSWIFADRAADTGAGQEQS
jgi:hypothetical protein